MPPLLLLLLLAAPQLLNVCSPQRAGCCLQTGIIDHDKLEEKAMDYRPKLIICGGSAYPREWDYARLRQIAGTLIVLHRRRWPCGAVAAKQRQQRGARGCGSAVNCGHRWQRRPCGSGGRGGTTRPLCCCALVQTRLARC